MDQIQQKEKYMYGRKYCIAEQEEWTEFVMMFVIVLEQYPFDIFHLTFRNV